jgi:FKBP-type peptidyl-prolyl cis-trans isomerase FkpA
MREVRGGAICLLAVISLALAGCDDRSPLDPRNVTFNPELEVDLDAMTRTASGLYYRDFEVGTGPAVTVGDEVEVYYTGWFPNGNAFDSRTSGTPLSFPVGAGWVIEGWDEGLQGMRVGGDRQLVIPPQLAYGMSGSGPIPPNAVLVFRVLLVNIVDPGDDD